MKLKSELKIACNEKEISTNEILLDNETRMFFFGNNY
jgi:hypothetical protein